MRVYLATAVSLLAACALTVAVVDPGHRYLRPVPPPSAPIEPGFANVLNMNHDERVQKRALAAIVPRADVVVFGSSRAMTVKTAMFAPGTKLLNLGVSGGTLDDDLGMYQALVEADHLPKVAMIFVDAWVFNRHREQHRWISVRAERDRFLAAAGALPLTERARSEADWWSVRATEASELIAFPTLRAAVGQLVRHRGLPPAHGAVVRVADLAPTDQAFCSDGGLLSRDSFETPPPDEIDRVGRAFATASTVYSLSPWELDEIAQTRLQLWLTSMRQRGVTPLLVLPPYQTAAYDLLLASPVYGPVFARYREIVRATGAASCDRVDPRAIPCAGTEFVDGMHAIDACVTRLVDGCLRASPELSSLAR